jgi:hypothetical protein
VVGSQIGHCGGGVVAHCVEAWAFAEFVLGLIQIVDQGVGGRGRVDTFRTGDRHSDEFGGYRVARNAYQPAEYVIDRLGLVQSTGNLCHDVCQLAIMLVGGYHVILLRALIRGLMLIMGPVTMTAKPR